MREEDERLREAVERYGARWSKIAEAVGTRNGDQCWKRWYDCLDPRIDKSPWTAEEVRPLPFPPFSLEYFPNLHTTHRPPSNTTNPLPHWQDSKLLHLVSHTGRNWSDIVHQHFPNRTSLAAKNRYSILRRKQDHNNNNTSPSSSSKVKVVAAATSSTSTPSLTSSPYLGLDFFGGGGGGMLPATPSTTACTTPEPEFAAAAAVAAATAAGGGVVGGGEEWMALAGAEMEGLSSYQYGGQQHVSVSGAASGSGPEGWYTGTDGSQMGGGEEMGYDACWTTAATAAAAGVSGGSWMQHDQAGFEGGYGGSQMQTATSAVAVGYGAGGGGYYGQEEMLVEGGAYGYGENMLGVYDDGQSQMSQQGMYDGGNGGMVDQGMGGWQTGYGTGGW